MELSHLLANHPMAQSAELAERTAFAQVKEASTLSKTDLEQLENVAKKFEGIFVQQVMKQMQETIENASFDPEDNAGKQVHGMYCTFMADAVSEQGGFGMWKQIYHQLVQMKEASVDAQAAVSQLDEHM